MGSGTNYVAGDFHLRYRSPCRNKGDNQDWMEGARDLDGLPRINENVVDMGVFELHEYGVVIDIF